MVRVTALPFQRLLARKETSRPYATPQKSFGLREATIHARR